MSYETITLRKSDLDSALNQLKDLASMSNRFDSTKTEKNDVLLGLIYEKATELNLNFSCLISDKNRPKNPDKEELLHTVERNLFLCSSLFSSLADVADREEHASMAILMDELCKTMDRKISNTVALLRKELCHAE
ncbi:hypothetical protein [Maridesulfovibrio ferrireducens]|uniref:hypothetical protein n=1 Tax=Maridesulfovibrio ferrireducens TaxID=246191 RepID=UPI001A1948A5|nr:hypothetical protein [Maridesulfovibrio ferrireducens]MBI9112263.1 hypothetical protein [Maridesulfovibrio ferrireducens]